MHFPRVEPSSLIEITPGLGALTSASQAQEAASAPKKAAAE
jgi:hypothetical protein